MCGIVGILGREPVAEEMVEALKRLEYRGYDSAGVADAAVAGERFAHQSLFEVLQLAFGAAARQMTALEGGNAG